MSDIHVFKWDSSAKDPLVEITGIDAGACAGGKLGTKTACAFANTGLITRPWGAPLASPYFYEGGLNLSAIFPNQAVPCFSTFISNTRTSQSTDAVLKDYAKGSIDTCGSIVIKKVTQPSGAAQKFDFTSDVTGNATFQLADGESKPMSKLAPGTYPPLRGRDRCRLELRQRLVRRRCELRPEERRESDDRASAPRQGRVHLREQA